MKNAMDEKAVIAAVKSALPAKDAPIGLHEPLFAGNEWNYLKECLDTGWVSSAGRFVDRFEQQLAEFTGVKRAVAVVNGTAALHICLKLAGVEQGDEVLTPA
ncbi:MAG TPA: DegT/DnrJ/EryC1/StrS family aminotransferase, partial [Negativicutes bacterium]|nr:DegT/DnrJ/EryC1/StrS family aminotransferase [Negativicutes bacterium]